MPVVAEVAALPDPAAVRIAAEEVAAADGVAPLGEAFVLALDHPGDHRLVGAPDGGLLGYAALADDGSAELFVVPSARRQGVGRALVAGLLTSRPDARLWAHGDLPPARALATAEDLAVVRRLLVLTRPLRPQDAADPDLPDGLRVRAFVPGRDDAALLAVNSAAFAHHPEQGALDQDGLEERMALPWFDPAGLLLLVEADPTGEGGERVVGFHWTKVEDGVGEVYVVGLSPQVQGRGLSGPLTRLGLAHLARQDLREVELYVEGDNEPALATYRRTGFAQRDLHVMYSRPVHRRLPD